MSQIFEYTKHSDRYLIHHYSFEGNNDMSIGRFVGNYSMNKFMSPLEWLMIFDHLAKLIEKYVKKPKTKRSNDSIHLVDTNIELNVEWSDMDAAFYGKMFPSIDLEMVYPFVMVIKVSCKSNMNKFLPLAVKGSSQTINNVTSQKNTSSVPKAKTSTNKTLMAKVSATKSPIASTSNTNTPTPKSPKKSASLAIVSTSKTVESMAMNVNTKLSKTIEPNASVDTNGMRPFKIALDRLTVDEIDKLTGSPNSTIHTGGEKKRKHKSLNDDSVLTPQKEMPAKRPALDTPFVNSVNSTPYVRLSKIEPQPIETDVSRILTENDKTTKTKAGPKSSKIKKVNISDKNRLTKMPLLSKRTGAKNAKPQFKLSIGHLTAKPKKSSKKKMSTHKVKKSKKVSKLVNLVNGDSSSLEIIDVDGLDPLQQPSTSGASYDKENHRPDPESNGHSQSIDLKNLTEDEVIAGFYRNNKLLMALFKQNVRQEEIQRAGDYTPIDIITLLSHQQFAKMLDILYEHFKGYSNKECETIFFDIIIPEWTLALFMRKTALDRDTAIELIHSQKTQNHDQSTMLSYTSFKEE